MLFYLHSNINLLSVGNFRTHLLTYFQSSMFLRIFDSFGGIRHNDIQFNAPRHIRHAIMDILRNTSQSLPLFLFLNAVIYCWKMTHIPHTIMNILRNISWLRNFRFAFILKAVTFKERLTTSPQLSHFLVLFLISFM